LNSTGITFPPGKWVEVLNTDDERFGGSGNNINADRVIHSDGRNNQPIKVSAYSTLMFVNIDQNTSNL
jgi:hypothetical protein